MGGKVVDNETSVCAAERALTHDAMNEIPPVPRSTPEAGMTLEQLDAKIRELTEDLDNAARSNQGKRELETVLAEIVNERARYMMERQRRLVQKL